MPIPLNKKCEAFRDNTYVLSSHPSISGFKTGENGMDRKIAEGICVHTSLS